MYIKYLYYGLTYSIKHLLLYNYYCIMYTCRISQYTCIYRFIGYTLLLFYNFILYLYYELNHIVQYFNKSLKKKLSMRTNLLLTNVCCENVMESKVCGIHKVIKILITIGTVGKIKNKYVGTEKEVRCIYRNSNEMLYELVWKYLTWFELFEEL